MPDIPPTYIAAHRAILLLLLLCESPPPHCESMWPRRTVSALSCSFRNTYHPRPCSLTPSLLLFLSPSLSHRQSSLKAPLMGTLMVRAEKNTCPGETGWSRLLFSPKGTRWIPPRAKWRHNTEPQTTDVKRSLSGTLYQSLSLEVTSRVFSLPLCLSFVQIVSVHFCGLISWTGYKRYPCRTVTAGLLWLHLCLPLVALLSRPKVTGCAAVRAAISLV